VTLTKAAPTVSLTKRGGSRGTLRVNLQWNARPEGAPAPPPPARGLFKRLQQGSATGNIDLDLACMYEYTDGSKGVVQALGGSLRDQFAQGPICWLDKDDRSGSSADGENLFVDLSKVASIKRILVFAFIYEGITNWAGADAVVTLHPASGPQIEVRLDEHDPSSSMCAIAMLENVGGELNVSREVRYVGGHRDLDAAYGWGMRWTAGRK
jgi:tellurite resistance protein TerA